MERFFADAIVAGSRELDRREEILNKLMQMLSSAITKAYREESSYTAAPPLGVFWAQVPIDNGLQIRVLTDKHRSEFGLKAVFWKDGFEDTFAHWRMNGQVVQGLSTVQISRLWACRDKIATDAVTQFPKIESLLETFAAFAPAQ